jgi:uncharacterized spore protein YtfJ
VGANFGSGVGAGAGAAVHPMKYKRIRMICDKARILVLANNDFIFLLLSSYLYQIINMKKYSLLCGEDSRTRYIEISRKKAAP